MRQDHYFQPSAPDPVHDEQTVLGIVRQYVPRAKALVYVDETGGEARMYAVDEDIILKVQRPQQLRLSTSLEKEAFFLKQLEKQTDVSVPRVLGYGRKGSIEYTCMTRIPGVAVRYAELTDKQKAAMLFELGKTLRIIHDIDQQAILESGLFPKDDEADLVDRLRIRCQAYIDTKIEAITQEVYDNAVYLLDEQLQKITNVDRFVALHTNPWITHTFVDKASGAYAGLIDFGDAYIGHPIFDLRRWGVADRPSLFAGYIAKGPVSGAFQTIYDAAYAIDKMIAELG